MPVERVFLPFPAFGPAVPSEVHKAFAAGIPRDLFGGRYSSAPALTWISAGAGSLIRFGTSGVSRSLCVEPSTGHIVDLDPRGERATFVNSTLGKFSETVDAVVSRFPYYSRDATDAQIDSVSDELRQMVAGIDERALEADQFWSTFLDDVMVGDFATEEVEEKRPGFGTDLA